MSEIRATTISDAAGTGPITLTGQSAAKAWAFFTTKTTTTLLGSINVSSLIDGGTGSTEIYFSNTFINDDYAASAIAGDPGISTAFGTDVGGRTSSVFQVQTRSTANANIDCARVSVTFHGDLA